jgi:polyribonucleotide nucleotidyltransferase
MDYGALLEVHPGGMRSLLHISELAPHRVRSVGEELAVGQEVEVMCLGRDARGQLKLSRKAVLKRDAVSAAAAASVAQGGAIDPDSPDK